MILTTVLAILLVESPMGSFASAYACPCAYTMCTAHASIMPPRRSRTALITGNRPSALKRRSLQYGVQSANKKITLICIVYVAWYLVQRNTATTPHMVQLLNLDFPKRSAELLYFSLVQTLGGTWDSYCNTNSRSHRV